MAALGAIPWAGSVISAAAALSAEKDQGKTNKLIFLWVQEHETRLRELVLTLQSVIARLESFGDSIKDRLESEEYLRLVRKTFRVWDEADTAEKKEMLRKLITNAGGTTIVSDEIIRLFIELLDRFNELHFKIIREVYLNPGITTYELGLSLFGEIPRDDSAEADLFKFLMHDLNMTDIVRGERESDHTGKWLKKTPTRRSESSTLKSPFDSEKGQVLTELAKQFVHYVMEELAPQLGSESKL